MSYQFNFSTANDEAAILVGILTGLGSYVELGFAPLHALYAGVLAGAAVLGYTGTVLKA